MPARFAISLGGGDNGGDTTRDRLLPQDRQNWNLAINKFGLDRWGYSRRQVACIRLSIELSRLEEGPMSQGELNPGYALVRLADGHVYWRDENFGALALDKPPIAQWLAGLKAKATDRGLAEEAAPTVDLGEAIRLIAHCFQLEGQGVALLVASTAKERGTSTVSTLDELTGLADRGALEAKLAELPREGDRLGPGYGLLFLDLDGFKQINDQFGHLAGDEVLATIASRLTAVVREGDFIARYGGDEFVILVESRGVGDRLDALAERLRRAIDQPVETPTGVARLSVSVGIATTGERFETARELLAAADHRMYQEKRDRRRADGAQPPGVD